MKRSIPALCLLVAALVGAANRTYAEPSNSARQYWGQWRGPLANGVAPEAKPPTEWSEEKNIRWKVELPGDGHSTPIVWGDRVYVQIAAPVRSDKPEAKSDNAKSPEAAGEKSDAKKDEPESKGATTDRKPPDGAERAPGDRERGPRDGERRGGPDGERRDRPPGGPEGERRGPGGRGSRGEAPKDPHEFAILAFDRRTGKEIWKHVVRTEVPHEGSHTDGSLAPASPFTDGENVYAHFGSRGLYAFDMSGKLLWDKDLGDMKTRNGFGEGSTPVLHGDTIVVPWDHESDSFVVALDKKTGAEKWRKSRDEVTSWATPLVVEGSGKKQVILPGTKRVRAYDILNGDVIWECGGLGANCVPSPVAAFGMAILMTGFREAAGFAVKYENAKGDLTGSDSVTWKIDKGTSYVPSPLLYDDTLYFLQKNSEILSCLDAKNGKPHYEQTRLEEIDGVYSSPIGADNHVYILGRNGTTYVLKKSPQFEVVATNKLNDDFAASPAAAGNELYLRGRKHLYCIAKDK